ncbi:peptidase S28 [Xylariaceae sp. FL0016]|nr:peptidase S28 [Xylariaceae sp. FL0016]
MNILASFATTLAVCVGVINAQALPESDYPSYPPRNFTQKLNHDLPNDETTFQQLYQLDTSHFKPGGPILFHQSEESAMTPIEGNIFSEYAPKVNGILAGLEHRFFGTSFPPGSTYDNITTEAYGPLTLENVLQDSVEFVDWVRSTVPGAENSPVIYTGGSYGGFLAVMARIRHPETFYGSLSISPLLRSWGAGATLAENPYKFAATDWLAQVYYDLSAEAAWKIRNAVQELDNCVKASNCDTMIPGLSLCTQPASAGAWNSLLWDGIVEQYAQIAQFSMGVKNLYAANALQQLINATLAASTTAEVLRAPLAIKLGLLDADYKSEICLNWTQIATSGGSITGQAWDYISCTYVVATESSVSPSNPLFPAHQTASPVTGCSHPEWEGPMYSWTNEQTVAYYGISDEQLDRVERLLIVHGDQDRTTAIGMPELSFRADRNHSRVIVVPGLAHGESIMPERYEPRGIKTQLDLVRFIVLAYRHS